MPKATRSYFVWFYRDEEAKKADRREYIGPTRSRFTGAAIEAYLTTATDAHDIAAMMGRFLPHAETKVEAVR